jgi:hydrogenase maturation protease
VSERTAPLDPQQAVTLQTLALSAYEAGRPSEAEACRVGDDRFLVKAAQVEGA